MQLANLSREEVSEMALIEIANLLLIEKKEAIDFKIMMDEIQKLLGLTDAEASEKMGQFYTDLNVDGRFISIGDNRWGLKGWYPVEQVEEETVPASKVKKKKAKKALVDDFDDVEEDLDFDDLDDFDEDEDDDSLIDDDFDDDDDLDEDIDEDDEDLIEDEDEYDLDDEDEEDDDTIIDEEEEEDR